MYLKVGKSLKFQTPINGLAFSMTDFDHCFCILASIKSKYFSLSNSYEIMFNNKRAITILIIRSNNWSVQLDLSWITRNSDI